jgi:hypothetical protein
MAVRTHEPDRFTSATIGRVMVVRYRVMPNLPDAQQVYADYQDHCRALGGRTGFLTVSEHPALPMPPVEVRAYWRESLVSSYGVEAFASVSSGFVGLAAAAVSNLLEHLIDPGLGIPFRVFSSPTPAVTWLEKHVELGMSTGEILEQIKSLRAMT